jgi:hypothetical protein
MIAIVTEEVADFVHRPADYDLTLVRRLYKLDNDVEVVGFVGNRRGKEFVYFPALGMNDRLDAVSAPVALFGIFETEPPAALVLVAKVGGINPLLCVGDIVIPQDFADFTSRRHRSYLQHVNPRVSVHYSLRRPICRKLAANLFAEISSSAREEFRCNTFLAGTYVCTEGPGFETRSEIVAFSRMGFDCVGHTLAPMVYYARELGLCFAAVCLVSNAAEGLASGSEAGGSAWHLSRAELSSRIVRLVLLAADAALPTGCDDCSSDELWFRRPTERSRLFDCGAR